MQPWGEAHEKQYSSIDALRTTPTAQPGKSHLEAKPVSEEWSFCPMCERHKRRL